MSTATLSRRRVLVLLPLALIACLAWWATRPDSEAVASSAAPTSTVNAGKIAFTSLPGSVDATLPLRSFSAGGTNASTPVGGGGGTGKFVAADATAVVDASASDPLLLQTVTNGLHLPSVTVTLFRPGTSSRQEVWQLSNVTVGALSTTQTGSAKAPRMSIGLRYAQVEVTTYDAQGKVARSYCFDLQANSTC